MPSKALVTGATGFLGRQVVLAFSKDEWDVVGTGYSRANPPAILKIDLGDHEAVSRLLDEEKPQVVVHCAANRFPDKCDADPEGTRALNVEATAALAKATSSRGIFLIYISTDYVFPGREGEAPYEVESQTNPPNLYGQTKLDGEKVALQETEQNGLAVVLRVPVLYGPAEKNSESAVNVLLDVLQKAQEKDAAIAMDDWAQRYPTNTEDVGRVCKDIAIKYLEAGNSRASLPRVLQFSSEDRTTKYQICQMIAEFMGMRLDGLRANKAGNDPSSTPRPYDTHLSTKTLKEIGIPVWTQDFKGWWRKQNNAFRH